MFKFIENIGDYFSGNYFTSDFKKNVIEKSGYSDEDLKSFESAVRGLKEKYFAFKKDYIDLTRCKDQIQRTNKFHNEVLKLLGYDAVNSDYNDLFHLDDTQVIPVRQKLYRGDKPHLFIMEMKALIKTGEQEPKGLFEQNWNRAQWESVFEVQDGDTLTPSVINEAINELFLIDQHIRPTYILLMAGNEMYLLHFEKWFKGSYLRFKLEDLFDEATLHKDYYQLFYLLLSKNKLAPEADILLMDQLDEDSHKSAYAVTKDLKEGIIHAVELLANEALYYKKQILKEEFEESEDAFEQQMKDDCLTMVYRLLFVFYAESRPDLGILPMNDQVYEKGYSLDMLRELEQVQLNSESSRIGYFFHESLQSLFQLLNHGYRYKEVNNKSFTINRLDTPLFDDEKFHHLKGIKFRNGIWQDIICQLSLSQKQRGKARGRISYANLGINQLGSVYEGLLAYRGFYAEQDYIEVHEAGKPNEGTFVVPRSRLDDFEDNEILKNEEGKVKILTKGTFVYRLSGRDRQQSASYYTPEVLTRTTVKYTLKPILERLDKKEIKADDLLDLKILEPAQGASAFQNEVVNQIADAYLDAKQIELKKKVPAKDYQDQLQRVKAFIATNNVYGVDINPTAIELGKLSLWLNVIHKDMEVPYFGYRLGVGNAVVGTWLKVYNKKDILFEKDNKKEKKEWWEKAPEMRAFSKGKLARKEDEIYHFLLPDKNMAPSAGIKLLKAEYPAEAKRVTEWKTEFTKPIRGDEFIFLQKICDKLDELLEEHYTFQNLINQYTGEKKNFFGHEQPQGAMFTAYDEKDQLAQQRHKHNAPYFKLKMVMDYWCALWFWDVRQAIELPTRKQWYEDIKNILELDLDTVLTEEEDLFSPIAEQQTIFEEPKQARLKSYRSDKEKEVSIDSIKKYANRSDLFENKRLETVKELTLKHRFFHSQLEFVEVFKQRGGFDIIVGNPPWVVVNIDLAGFLSEMDPICVIRNYDSDKNETLLLEVIDKNQSFKAKYYNDLVRVESSKTFSGAKANYILIAGQKPNLHKLVIENCIGLSSGISGIIHDKGIYEDNNGQFFRQTMYKKLEYYFQLQNELKLFSEVGNTKKFEISVFNKNKKDINFYAISNLFHPSTIEQCFANKNKLILGIRNENNEWELRGNQSRLIKIDSSALRIYSELFEEGSSKEDGTLANIHSTELNSVLLKFNLQENKLKKYENDIEATIMLDETKAKREGIVNRNPTFVDDKKFVLAGPHFYVGNPYFQTPNEGCSSHRDYSNIDLTTIDENYLPRTIYELMVDGDSINKDLNYFYVNRKRAQPSNERTLMSCIQPARRVHTIGSHSLHFKDELLMLSFSAYSFSIVYDFYVRITNREDILFDTISNLPLFEKPNEYILNRALLLNCITKKYEDLWNKYSHLLPEADSFCSKEINLGEKFLNNKNLKWSFDLPLKDEYSRRQALLEIDVLVALELDLTWEEFITIYKIQFPVLASNESKILFDKNGREATTAIRNEYLKDIENNRIKIEYGGYYPPFIKCDRVEDYKRAWAHFEERFKEK
jgi:hypothetical protein